MNSEPERVDEYLAALPAEQRAALERMRATIRRVAPHATEGIAYQMPAFYSGDRFLVSYAAFKKHLSLFPGSGTVMDEFGEELSAHRTGKGTLQFTVEQPLSDELLEQLVRIRLEEPL